MFSEEEVTARVREIAEQISREYAGKKLHLICILKGSVFFTCVLAKYLTIPVTMDFMTVSSYGASTESSGKINVKQDLSESIEGRDVLVIEDIIDSGRTLSYLLKELAGRRPASLRLCTLLDKPDRRVANVHVDYTGFNIPDAFVVGFGLDYDQRYRNLPYVGVLHFED